MMSGLLIRGGTIVNEGESYRGWIVVENERIARTGRGDYPRPEFDGETIDAEGMYVLPGVIDDQVHFREPGLTYKGDLHSESIAAAAGGVTSYMDMPNVKPPTVTNALLEEKLERAAETSVVNYSFYLGATNDNIEQIRRLDLKRVCGVKLFMGSSTGNMLVDDERALRALFAESPVPIAAHCEDEPTVRADMERFRTLYGESGLTAAMHPLIRSAEACLRSSEKAVSLAERYGGRLHVLHLSTARELSLFDRDKPLEQKRITCEVCVHHLWFSDADYARKGNLIKWNPAVKTAADRDALRAGLLD
ncbi:MAG: dihydroorotase, partial [Alistipes ihumii]|nr:dihydroorotase [Alistipes ihumii]